MESPNLESSFRGVAGQIPAGVAIVFAMVDDEPHAATASSVIAASFDPPVVAVFLSPRSRTLDRLKRAGQFGISFLEAGDHAIAQRLAVPGHPAGWEGLAGIDLIRRGAQPPIVARATAWLDCRVDRLVPVGDHVCVFGLVVGCGRRREAEPLVYYRGRFRVLGPSVAAAHWPAADPSDLAADW